MSARAIAAVVLSATLLASPAAIAQDAHDGHGDHAMPQADGTATSPAAAAFAEANAAMHEAMDIDYTGDADIDFVRGMIAHHEGAIEMAKILKQYGKAPELLALADTIIVAQEKEVADMKAWLAAKGLE